MTRDSLFTQLRGEGYEGALEDMMFDSISGSGSLEDKVYREHGVGGGVNGYLDQQREQSAFNGVTLGGESVTFGGDPNVSFGGL